MITDEPTRSGLHRFWPEGVEPTVDTARLMMVSWNGEWLAGGAKVSELRGKWEFVPEPPPKPFSPRWSRWNRGR